MNKAITILEDLLRPLVLFSIEQARIVVGFSLLITGAAVWYTAAHFTIHTSTDDMIDSRLSFRQTYEDFNHAFPQFSNTFTAVIDGPSPEAVESAQAEFSQMLAKDSRYYSSIFAPGQDEFFKQKGLLLLDEEKLIALTDELAMAEPLLAAISEDPSLRGLFSILNKALDDALAGEQPNEKLAIILDNFAKTAEESRKDNLTPFSWQSVFLDNKDLSEAKRRLVVVQPELDFKALNPAKESLERARAAAQELKSKHPGTNIRFTGKIALNSDELQSVTSGMMWSGLLSFVLVALVLTLGIRSARLVFAGLAVIFMGLFWTAAIGLVAVGYFNILSIAFAVLFIGLGIDYAIHLVLRYREEFYESGKRDAALATAALTTSAPLALCATTTVLAFFSFVFTSYVGLAQLGLIAGIGIVISFLTSLTTLPAVLCLFPLKRKISPSSSFVREEVHFVERHAGPIAIVCLATLFIGMFAIPRIRFDLNPINLKSRKTESVAAFFDLIKNEKTSPYAIQILAKNSTAAEKIQERLESLPSVRTTTSLASFVPHNQEEKMELIQGAELFMSPVFLRRDLGRLATVSEEIAEIKAFQDKAADLAKAFPGRPLAQNAQALSEALEGYNINNKQGMKFRSQFKKNIFFWFPALLDRLETQLSTSPISPSDVPDSIKNRYVTSDGRWRLEVYPTQILVTNEEIASFVKEITAVTPMATGTPVQIYNSGHVVKNSMIQATVIATVLVLSFLYFFTRSLRKLGFILLPILITVALTACAMWLFDIAFNFANVIVLPLVIGIGVDNGIHLVWRSEMEHGTKRVLRTSTPRAILLSSLTTLGSFGTLALSAHKGTSSMGVLLTVSLLAGLAATLIALPGLLAWWAKSLKKSDTR